MDFCAGVRSDLTQFVSAFEPWAEGISSDLADQLAEQTEQCRENREKEQTLTEERTALQNLSISQRRACDEEEFRSQQLLSVVQEVGRKAAEMPAAIEKINAKLEESESTAERLRLAASNAEHSHSHGLSVLDRTMENFRRHLGLNFAVTEEKKLKISFSLIKTEEPEKEFFVKIFIDENNLYQSDSHSLGFFPDGKLDFFIEKLNRDNQFGQFVYSIRKEFKDNV